MRDLVWRRHGNNTSLFITQKGSLTDQEAEKGVHLPSLHGWNLRADVQVDTRPTGGGAELREGREVFLKS